ncbi:hypothetical protein PTB13_08500, partial [Bacillus sp. MHSD17]|nr:hypothetical protein [Bacillus sp. MHSD17]
SVSQGVAAYICLPKTAWPPTSMKAVCLIFIKSGRLSFFIKPDPCLFFVMRLEAEDWLFLLYW